MSAMGDMYLAMVEAMEANGRHAGVNAAAWWYQDALGGRASGDVSERAGMILAGIEDGDPVVMDALPAADLSGEWADGDTAESVYAETADTDWPEWDTLAGDVQTELADAWSSAFDAAAMSAVERYCAAAMASDSTA